MSLYSFTATPNPMMALWRPLLVAVGLGMALQLVLTMILRNANRAALVACAIVLSLDGGLCPTGHDRSCHNLAGR